MFSSGRYEVLEYALAGLRKSGLLLIEYDGFQFGPLFTPRPIGSADDLGIFIIIPKLVQIFNVSLDQAIKLFFNSAAIIAISMGLIGIVFLYGRSRKQLALGFLSIIGAFFFAWSMTHDVQLMYSFGIIGSLPFLLFCLNKLSRSIWLYPIFFITGFIYGCINYIRLNAILGMIIWLLISLWLLPKNEKSILGKISLSIVFFLGISLPRFYVARLENLSDEFLKNNSQNYIPTSLAHPFWHTIYAGFGFSNFLNTKNLAVADEVGLDAAARRNNGTIAMSHPSFDGYLRQEVRDLCLHEPFFVLTTLASKFGILLYYLFRYANVVLIALFFSFSTRTIVPMVAGLCAYALIPLLYVPCGPYALGFITFIQISSMIIVNDFLSTHQNKKNNWALSIAFGFFIIVNTIGSFLNVVRLGF